jgi:hypothetical protein
MSIAEIARNAHADLIATQRTPGLWQQTRETRLQYWREGLARKLSDVTGDPLIDSYQTIGATYDEVVAWCASVAGDDRRAA